MWHGCPMRDISIFPNRTGGEKKGKQKQCFGFQSFCSLLYSSAQVCCQRKKEWLPPLRFFLRFADKVLSPKHPAGGFPGSPSPESIQWVTKSNQAVLTFHTFRVWCECILWKEGAYYLPRGAYIGAVTSMEIRVPDPGHGGIIFPWKSD